MSDNRYAYDDKQFRPKSPDFRDIQITTNNKNNRSQEIPDGQTVLDKHANEKLENVLLEIVSERR